VVAIDAKRRHAGGWEVYTHGGRRRGIDTVEWARRVESLGAGEISYSPAWTPDGTQ